MTGRIASKLATNSQCTHWVSVPSPPVIVQRAILVCPNPRTLRPPPGTTVQMIPQNSTTQSQTHATTLSLYHPFQILLTQLQRWVRISSIAIRSDVGTRTFSSNFVFTSSAGFLGRVSTVMTLACSQMMNGTPFGSSTIPSFQQNSFQLTIPHTTSAATRIR